MVNYVCEKTVPGSTKLCLIKCPKSKFPGGTYPQTPLVSYMLCTRIHTYPSNNPYNLIVSPIGQETLAATDQKLACSTEGFSTADLDFDSYGASLIV